MSEIKTIYYNDELNDEFSDAKITAKPIDENYDYDGGVKRRIGRFFWYGMLAKPLGFLFLKVKFGHRIVNKSILRKARGKAFFLYGNHTNQAADPFIPSMLDFKRGVYVIVHPDNVSMPVLGKITPSLGALPLPDSLAGMKNFNRAIAERVDKKKIVMIYPEAHIWPYYTKIRPFKKDSFGYPVIYDTPVYCFTNTYVKRKFRKTPRIVTYVDGPFYPDKTLKKPEAKQKLRDEVLKTMQERALNSNVELVHYVKNVQTKESTN